MGRILMLCVLLVMGCGKKASSGDKVSSAGESSAAGADDGAAQVSCEDRARAMIARAGELSRAREVRDSIAPRRLVPVVDEGWRVITQTSKRLYIPLRGPLRFPADEIILPRELEPPGTRTLDVVAVPPSLPGTTFERDDIAEGLSQALASKLGGQGAVAIVADARVPAMVIEQVWAVLPEGVSGRLIVEKSPLARLQEHLALAPFTPERLRAVFRQRIEQENTGIETMFRQVAESTRWPATGPGKGPCASFEKVLDAVGQGMGISELLAVTGKAMIECQCEEVDMDALETALIFGLRPVQRHGFVPLPARGQDWPEHGDSATAADLAGALATTAHR